MERLHDSLLSFAFEKYTRTVNHIAAYLDRVTIYDRILKDDISSTSSLSRRSWNLLISPQKIIAST